MGHVAGMGDLGIDFGVVYVVFRALLSTNGGVMLRGVRDRSWWIWKVDGIRREDAIAGSRGFRE